MKKVVLTAAIVLAAANHEASARPLAYAPSSDGFFDRIFGHHTHNRSVSTLSIAQRYAGRGNPTGFRGPWCAAFANKVLREAGARSSGSNLARSLLAVGPRVSSPKPGDLVILARGRGGHATFFKGWTARGLVGLGGNQGRGRGVQDSVYPRSRVLAFVRPIPSTKK